MPSRPQGRGPQRWKVGAGLAAGVLAAGALLAIQKPEPVGQGEVDLLMNVDADVAGNGVDAVRDQILTVARGLADRGGGTFTVIAESGGAPETVTATDLRVERDGQFETDKQLRDRSVTDRVAAALAAAEAVRPSAPGRALLPLFAAAAEHTPAPGTPHSVFYAGFGLASEDPEDARVALAGEPGDAVDSIKPQLSDLRGAQLNAVFPAAAGPQPPLNPYTSQWRTRYWMHLARAMNASLGTITTSTVPAEAAAGAAPAPVIPNLPDPTPPPSTPRGEPAPVVLGSGAFLPESDQFVDDDTAERALAPLAVGWAAHPGAYLRAECVGRTAAVGPAPTARDLAGRRAARAAAQLRAAGVMSVRATGVGFDDPLPTFPPTDPHQRNVTCQLIPQPTL